MSWTDKFSPEIFRDVVGDLSNGREIEIDMGIEAVAQAFSLQAIFENLPEASFAVTTDLQEQITPTTTNPVAKQTLEQTELRYIMPLMGGSTEIDSKKEELSPHISFTNPTSKTVSAPKVTPVLTEAEVGQTKERLRLARRRVEAAHESIDPTDRYQEST